MGLKSQLKIAAQQLEGFEIPAMPAEVMQLQTLFQKTEFPDTAEIADIIARNTVLSGELILLANQAQFKRKDADEITTIRTAIESLGLLRLRTVIFGLAFKTLVSDKVFDELIEHTMDVSNVSAELSRWVEGVVPEEAYMAGLFHNAGAIIMAMKFDDYPQFFFNTLTNCYSGSHKEVSVYGAHHGVFGLLVAKKWQLASMYAQVMLMHHQMNFEIVKDPKAKTLVAIIQLANAIVSESSFDQYHGEEIKKMRATAQEELLIEDDVISEIRIALMSNSLV
ncbi:HDOD domain-containing protein [Hydrogenovibrio kuenenii]|uniref:HDOD domain-containing protein n=1 Tax=Hydrogenovibrio kuenenii TaxID=63658 RepID=UPI00046664F8|nr:HDOD domain-containing protein [Hydrogenovibrio kuenenii]